VLTIACLSANESAAAAEPLPEDLVQIDKLQSSLAKVADSVRPSVVAIRADRREDVTDDQHELPMPDDEVHRRLRVFPAVGTGIIIQSDGLVLTNEHVIHNADPNNIECVLSDGETYTVQGLTSDPRSDLAVLRVDARTLKAARLGDLRHVRQGHFAIVMGNPFGSASDNYGKSAMSFGIVSALGQDLTSKLDLSQQRYYGNLIQTDARINPGNSGGPLLNIYGEVIGITTAISTRSGTSEGVGYAIPIDDRTKEIIEHLKNGENVEYGFIGVELERPPSETREVADHTEPRGAMIKSVKPDTPAFGNLQPYDVVISFNSVTVDDVDQLIRMVGAANVGNEVKLTVRRNGQVMTVGVTPARKPGLLKGVHIEPALDWRGMKLVEPSSAVLQEFKLPDTVVGVVVKHVESNGAAAKVGIKPGSVIHKVADQPIRGLRRLRELVGGLNGPIKIVAGDTETEVTLPQQ